MPKSVIERELPGAGKLSREYIAPNEDIVREHASRGGFPANRISEVRSLISPTTAGLP